MRQVSENNHVFLHPGEYAVATADCTISTLLGSCVSIVLWHPAKKIGAMSHFILPTRGAKQNTPDSGRYGDEVLDLMLSELGRLKIAPNECQAKIYGGGNMFPTLSGQSIASVGKKNGDMARRELLARSIPIVAESLFGTGYRKIEFDIARGEVTSSHMESTPDLALLAYLPKFPDRLLPCSCEERAMLEKMQ